MLLLSMQHKLWKKIMLKPIYIENTHVVLLEGADHILEHINVKLFTFKEARDYFESKKEAVKSRMKENEEKVTEWRNNPPYINDATERFIEEMKYARLEEIKSYDRQIYRLKMLKDHGYNKKLLDVETAKAKPITDFIEFDRHGFASCLWHNENHGSMKYYDKTNTLYCFGCHESHDVIDVVQKLKNLTFAEAVRYLTQ